MGTPPLNLEHTKSSSSWGASSGCGLPGKLLWTLQHPTQNVPGPAEAAAAPAAVQHSFAWTKELPQHPTHGQAHSSTQERWCPCLDQLRNRRAASPSYILFLILLLRKGAPRPKVLCRSSWAGAKRGAELLQAPTLQEAKEYRIYVCWEVIVFFGMHNEMEGLPFLLWLHLRKIHDFTQK